ncbi:dienelactone hydrolase family protein [Chitinimonas naiadis]
MPTEPTVYPKLHRWLQTLLRNVLLVFGLTLFPSLWAQTLQADTQGRIDYASFTPKTMYDLARERRENWAPQPVWAYLSLPKDAHQPVPAMVLMHGSAGIEDSMAQWVATFNEMGIATFVVSSFEPRGVTRTVEDQSLVPPAATLMDGLLALQVLSTHPGIDAKRIGIMGFSRGGTVAFRTAIEPLRKAVLKSELKFALHIPVYSGCNQVYWSPQVSKASIINLVGEADDYTTAAACEQLARRYASAGANIRTIRYANANHSWDGTYPVHYLPNATTDTPCGTVRWDIESWKITAERTASLLDPAKLDQFFKGCVKLGAHVGRNEQAYLQSRRDVQALVREIFLLGGH